MLKYFFVVIVFVFSSISTAKPNCSVSSTSFFEHERIILRLAAQAKDSQNFMADSKEHIKCIFSIYKKSEQLLKPIIGRLISPFLGEPIPKELKQDLRYQKVYGFLVQEFTKRKLTLEDPVFREMAESYWSNYSAYCSPQLASICMAFLDSNKNIIKQPELAGVLSVTTALQAAHKLEAKERKELKKKLNQLLSELPAEKQFLKKVVEEAIKKMPVDSLPLGYLSLA